MYHIVIQKNLFLLFSYHVQQKRPVYFFFKMYNLNPCAFKSSSAKAKLKIKKNDTGMLYFSIFMTFRNIEADSRVDLTVKTWRTAVLRPVHICCDLMLVCREVPAG